MKATLVKGFTLAGLAALLAGCVSPDGRPDNAGTGALVGGLTGASIGAMASRGNPAGALIGGAAGALTGALVGHSVDEQNEARRQYYYHYYPAPATYASAAPVTTYPAAPPPRALSVSEIKSMSKAGISDDNIIVQINNTRSVFHLDAQAIIDLSNSGVSQKVISNMINTGSAVASQAPPTPPAETLAAAPGPDYTWVNGEWMWNGASWIWVSGRWVLGPYPHAVWVSPRWVYGPYGWHRAPGYWR